MISYRLSENYQIREYDLNSLKSGYYILDNDTQQKHHINLNKALIKHRSNCRYNIASILINNKIISFEV